MKYKLRDVNNKEVGDLDLLDSIFDQNERPDILHRVVNWQLAKRRAGTHQTKTLSMVSGSTRKPFRQKGTGRARQGKIRAPQHRGGATVFGPQVRDYSYSLPKKVRQLGLKVALSAKLRAGQLVIIDDFKLQEAKTKVLDQLLAKNGWNSALFICGEQVDQNVARASANVVGFDVLPQQGANVFSILKRKTLILSKDALEHLEARLK